MSIVLVPAAVSPAANTLGGQGWRQAGELGVALLLSGAIGLEREIRQKDAGLRTHIWSGSALPCSCWSASTGSPMSWRKA